MPIWLVSAGCLDGTAGNWIRDRNADLASVPTQERGTAVSAACAGGKRPSAQPFGKEKVPGCDLKSGRQKKSKINEKKMKKSIDKWKGVC